MSTLSYSRRTKGIGTEMVSVYTHEEVLQYFSSEDEWRFASRIYWERHNMRGHITYYLNKYKVSVARYNELMRKYAKFMLHQYERKEKATS